jgi:hypothetical protein
VITDRISVSLILNTKVFHIVQDEDLKGLRERNQSVRKASITKVLGSTDERTSSKVEGLDDAVVFGP